jgi:hypothetical protein
MSNDPSTITHRQLREALSVMGVDPDLDTLKSITIEPGVITAVRKRVNAEGKNFAVSYDRLATETTEIRLHAENEDAK